MSSSNPSDPPPKKCSASPSTLPSSLSSSTETTLAQKPNRRVRPPPMGPNPTLISRKEVDALYETTDAVTSALNDLHVPYIVTGGSLLGAIRQHSILFCDDDVDIAILETNDEDRNKNYELVSQHLDQILKEKGGFAYTKDAWEGSDRIRHTRYSTVFVDLFVIRQYKTKSELLDVIGMKKNGSKQSDSYVTNLLSSITTAAQNFSQTQDIDEEDTFPLWHFKKRKAIELWPKEVYRTYELFPLQKTLKFGPLANVSGPNMPLLLLRRAFGMDCFEVYYQSHSHQRGGEGNGTEKNNNHRQPTKINEKASRNENDQATQKSTTSSTSSQSSSDHLPPLVMKGGTWEQNTKVPLTDEHYVPMQPTPRVKRRYTNHCKESLFKYIQKQDKLEQEQISYSTKTVGHGGKIYKEEKEDSSKKLMIATTPETMPRPRKTIYTDGIFDLFHVGHLRAIKQCAQLGDRVIIGVTSDHDATSYKRCPIISEQHRIEILSSLKYVNQVICPCPLVVTEEFMDEYGIDLVVHGFANEEDEKKQEEFFAIAKKLGKFCKIGYCRETSTTDLINQIFSRDKDV